MILFKNNPRNSVTISVQVFENNLNFSVALAKSLINMSLDLHKASLERTRSSDDEDSSETPSRSRGQGAERIFSKNFEIKRLTEKNYTRYSITCINSQLHWHN